MFSSHDAFATQVVHQNGSLVLRLSGELDMATVPLLREVVAELVSPHLRSVTIDMSGLDFVDLVGLRAISEVNLAVAAANTTFRLRAVSVTALRVIRVAELDDLMAAIETTMTDIGEIREAS
jgi:anti-sigma B factor antagonist